MSEHTKSIPSIEELCAKVAKTELSSISAVVQKILGIIRDPNASVIKLKEVIEVDPPLSAKMLRRANSAFYGIGRQVTNIQESIVYLGFNTIREMAFSLKVSEFFLSGGTFLDYSRKALWKHSLAVALCAKNIYRSEFREDGNDIYSIALLHDLGIIAEEQTIPDAFVRLLELKAEQGVYNLNTETSLLNYDHAKIAQKLLAFWGFPSLFSELAGGHHNPFIAPTPIARAAMVLFIADQACERAGLGHDCFSPNESLRYTRALGLVDLKEKAVALLVEEVMEELRQMEAEGELF